MLAHVDNRITYSGNGNATEFAYQFKILDRTDIKVLLTDADGKEKLLTKDYYVDVEKNVVRYPGYAVGAEVPESERPPVLPAGWKLTIYREVPVTQETDLPDQYPFNQVEDIGDKLTMIAQQLTDVTSRSLKISVNKSADIDTTIPWENGKSFRISDDGAKIELTEDPARVLPLAQEAYTQAQAQAQSASASAAAANNYAANAKNYSENVNVFIPIVSAAGVLSWTNKAGLPNPASVNIKGAKGDTGTAATIEVGTVTTGAAGSSASVTNSGTSTNAVLNFTIPRGNPGADAVVTVDTALSATSTNPVQNKVIKAALDGKLGINDTAAAAIKDDAGNNIVDTYAKKTDISGFVKTVNGTAPDTNGNVAINVSGGGGVSTSEVNTWTAEQNFHDLILKRERYTTYVVNGTSFTPTTSTMFFTPTGAFTLNLATLTGALSNGQSSVFTAYFAANGNYTLTITNAGTIKYVGSASDVAITSAGLLLNIMMLKDASGNVTSIVQASKLS